MRLGLPFFPPLEVCRASNRSLLHTTSTASSAGNKMSSLLSLLRSQAGYAQGSVKNPTYSEVCSGKTGHTEAVQVCWCCSSS